jgi:hypothetical protein
VQDGAKVGEALFMFMYADSEHDKTMLRERLETYWVKHAVAVRPPWFVDSKWPSLGPNHKIDT